jgi:hypothetical protein
MAKKTDPRIVSPLATQSAALQASDALMERIVLILEAARGQVVRSVNTTTVMANWLIGHELVEAIQQGEQRAAYGEAVIARLAEQLTARYGRGFSVANLKNFRQFYVTYADRIRYPAGGELPAPIGYPPGSESSSAESATIFHALRGKSQGFDPALSWTHYRTLMRVSAPAVRQFYEQECAAPTGRAATWNGRSIACTTSACSPAATRLG